MSARFAICIPVRNGADYIGEAVRSALDQGDARVEVVVLDNCSQDTTTEIVGTIARSDSRVRLLRSAEPLSMEASWDRVRALCAEDGIGAEFLSLSGHDDRFGPDFLGTISGLVARYPEAVLYHTHFRLIDAGGQVTALSRPIPTLETQQDFFLCRAWELRDTFGTGYVFRRKDYLAVGGIPLYPRLMFADDMLWLRLLGRGPKATAPGVCFEYRRHESNTSSVQTPERYLATLQSLERLVADATREFPQLFEGEMAREGLRRLIVPILTHTEKGTYRTGLARAQVQPHYDALCARLRQAGFDPPALRSRPVKRGLHAARRYLQALRPR